MKWNNLTTKQRILWVTLLVCSVMAVGVLVYKQLVGEEVTVHNWCMFTFAACSIANAYFTLTHPKRKTQS